MVNSAVCRLAVVLFSSLMLSTGTAFAGSPGGGQSGGKTSGCALLPRSLVEEATGTKFHEPTETNALPAYDGAWGSNCEYSRMEPFPQGQDTRVDLMIFVEASPSEAKATFDKAAAFLADHSKPALSGIGDSAYWGTNPKEPTIHVLKGKVHFQLGMMYPADEIKLLHLATALAGRL